MSKTASTIIRDGVAYTRFFWSASNASGGRKGWGKDINTIDRLQRGGYAINGEFLLDGIQEMVVGQPFIDMEPGGSTKNGTKLYSLARVVDVETFVGPTDEITANAKRQGFVWIFTNRSELGPAELDEVEKALAAVADRNAWTVAFRAPPEVEDLALRQLANCKGTTYGYCVKTESVDAPDHTWYGTYTEALVEYREASPFVAEAVRYFGACNPNSWPIVKARREYLSDRIVTVTPARTVNGVWTSDYEVADYEVSK